MDFKTATSAELKAVRKEFRVKARAGDMTDEQLAGMDELDDLIADRVLDEKMATVANTEDFKAQAKKFDAKAKGMWPELKNPDSAFTKKVDAALEASGRALDDPMALLNAANLIGIEEDMSPSGVHDPEKDPALTKVKSGESGVPAGEGNDNGKDHVDNTPDIGHMFRDMLDLNNKDVRATIQAHADNRENK